LIPGFFTEFRKHRIFRKFWEFLQKITTGNRTRAYWVEVEWHTITGCQSKNETWLHFQIYKTIISKLFNQRTSNFRYHETLVWERLILDIESIGLNYGLQMASCFSVDVSKKGQYQMSSYWNTKGLQILPIGEWITQSLKVKVPTKPNFYLVLLSLNWGHYLIWQKSTSFGFWLFSCFESLYMQTIILFFLEHLKDYSLYIWGIERLILTSV